MLLRFDETVEHEGLRLRLLAIEDSRCPRGVQCIWEGQVTVTVEVSRDDAMESQSSEEQREEAEAGAVAETVELVLRGGKDQAIEVVAGHELQLTNVEPHPKEGVTTERGAHVVTVEVLRL